MKRNRDHLRKAGKYILIFHICYIFIIAAASLLFIFIDPPFISLMGYRYIFNDIDSKKHYTVPVQYIPRKYLNLLVYTEDPTFYRHIGIDFPSMYSAFKANTKYGKKLYGGSTITQQLARTMFLFPEKLYVRKYLEVIAAVTMDLVMPKQRILELYVNYAEWGRGIYGIQSASYYYYGKSVYKCDQDQVLRLITLLPSPCRYSPYTFERRYVLRLRYERLNEMLNTYYQ